MSEHAETIRSLIGWSENMTCAEDPEAHAALDALVAELEAARAELKEHRADSDSLHDRFAKDQARVAELEASLGQVSEFHHRAEQGWADSQAEVARLREALEARAEHWEQDAAEAEFAANSYKGADNEAAVALFRQAARSHAVARELRACLAGGSPESGAAT